MKYKFVDVIQDYSYSCLDELRVDLMETMRYLERTSHKCAWITVVLSRDNAKSLYDLLLTSEYNGVKLHLHPDFYEDDEMFDAKNIAITINSDSEIIVEELDTSLTCGFEFLAIDKSISEYERITERYTDDVDSSDYILRFIIE